MTLRNFGGSLKIDDFGQFLIFGDRAAQPGGSARTPLAIHISEGSNYDVPPVFSSV